MMPDTLGEGRGGEGLKGCGNKVANLCGGM